MIDEIIGFLWKMIKIPSQWLIKKIIKDWIALTIQEVVNGAIDKERERIVSSSITVQKLQAYDEVYCDFSKRLSYAIGRCFEYHKAPDEFDEIHVMKQVNEVRQTRLRFLSVCGPKIKSFLLDAGTEWLNDVESFLKKAYEIENRIGELISEDRHRVEQSGDESTK